MGCEWSARIEPNGVCVFVCVACAMVVQIASLQEEQKTAVAAAKAKAEALEPMPNAVHMGRDFAAEIKKLDDRLVQITAKAERLEQDAACRIQTIQTLKDRKQAALKKKDEDFDEAKRLKTEVDTHTPRSSVAIAVEMTQAHARIYTHTHT